VPDEDHGNSLHSGLVIAVRPAGTEALRRVVYLKPGTPAGCQAKLWRSPALFLAMAWSLASLLPWLAGVVDLLQS
jgi:hypothetical protein